MRAVVCFVTVIKVFSQSEPVYVHHIQKEMLSNSTHFIKSSTIHMEITILVICISRFAESIIMCVYTGVVTVSIVV